MPSGVAHHRPMPTRGWSPILQKRSITRMGRFQKEMVVTSDSFLGVRFLSAESAGVIGVQRCLGRTVRSQGFSPSQRFSPTRASWLCFTPHPPIGFRSSEPFPHRQPRYLSISVALLSFRQPSGASGEPVTLVGPHLLSTASSLFSEKQHRISTAHPCDRLDITLAGHPTCVGCPGSASGPCNPEG